MEDGAEDQHREEEGAASGGLTFPLEDVEDTHTALFLLGIWGTSLC
jgi:hypothetical protein